MKTSTSFLATAVMAVFASGAWAAPDSEMPTGADVKTEASEAVKTGDITTGELRTGEHYKVDKSPNARSNAKGEISSGKPAPEETSDEARADGKAETNSAVSAGEVKVGEEPAK